MQAIIVRGWAKSGWQDGVGDREGSKYSKKLARQICVLLLACGTKEWGAEKRSGSLAWERSPRVNPIRLPTLCQNFWHHVAYSSRTCADVWIHPPTPWQHDLSWQCRFTYPWMLTNLLSYNLDDAELCRASAPTGARAVHHWCLWAWRYMAFVIAQHGNYWVPVDRVVDVPYCRVLKVMWSYAPIVVARPHVPTYNIPRVSQVKDSATARGLIWGGSASCARLCWLQVELPKVTSRHLAMAIYSVMLMFAVSINAWKTGKGPHLHTFSLAKKTVRCT